MVTVMSGLDQETHDMINKWAHRTFIQVKRKPQKKATSVLVQSIDELSKLMKSNSKVSRIAALPKKKMQKVVSSMPNIHLEDDECLALVDSGSTINAADIKKHFPQYASRIVTSKDQMMGNSATTAGGHQLPNLGRCRVDATVEGHNFPVPFQNLKVDVPIISVKKYLRNGYDFHFTEEGGYMRCRLNNRVFQFIEAEDAYWIKLQI